MNTVIFKDDFENMKNLKYLFGPNLIGHTQWNLYEDGFIIVTLRVHRTVGQYSILSPLTSYQEKNKQVQQWNRFPNSFKHLSHL